MAEIHAPIPKSVGKYEPKMGGVYLNEKEKEDLMGRYYRYSTRDVGIKKAYQLLKPFFDNAKLSLYFKFAGYSVHQCCFEYTPAIRAYKDERYSKDFYVVFVGDKPVDIIVTNILDSVFYQMTQKFGTERNPKVEYVNKTEYETKDN